MDQMKQLKQINKTNLINQDNILRWIMGAGLRPPPRSQALVHRNRLVVYA